MIYEAIEDSEWEQLYEQLYEHCKEIGRAVGVKKPSDNQEAKAPWKMRAARDRRDPDRADNILGDETGFEGRAYQRPSGGLEKRHGMPGVPSVIAAQW